MKKSLFLFDLDWTLVGTSGAGIRALNLAFKQLYQIPDAMTPITPDGKTDPAIIREMIHHHLGRGPGDGEIEQVCRMYLDRLKIEIAATEPYIVLPGIPELLETLSKRPDTLLGLGTGNLEEGARTKLARSQLMPYFKFGGFSSDAEERADVLRAAVRRAEMLASEPLSGDSIFVIGDHFRDIKAGKAIGAKTVAVATGHVSLEELSRYDPDFLFQNLASTETVLSTLFPYVTQH